MHGTSGTAVVMVVLLVAARVPADAANFGDILGTSIGRRIGDALAVSVGRSLPVISASAGVVFTFDPTSGAFERETSVAGQVFLERAQPIGRGRWNVSLNYQHVKIDRIEGEDIEQLMDNIPIKDPSGGFVTFPRFGLDLETHELTTSATCGLTDDLDLNLTIPVLFSEFQVHLLQNGSGGPKGFGDSAAALGVGDIFLRGKYRLLKTDWMDGALGLVLRLPAGNKDNFQGTGAVELAPLLYVSGKGIHTGRWIKLVPYLNAGANFDTEDVGASEARWGVGLDAAFVDRVTLAVAVLGRHEFRRIAPAGFFSFEREHGISRPLFGIRGARPDFYDLSVGGRVNLWRDTLIGFANVLVPLNDDGVRSLVIPTVGIEATF